MKNLADCTVQAGERHSFNVRVEPKKEVDCVLFYDPVSGVCPALLCHVSVLLSPDRISLCSSDTDTCIGEARWLARSHPSALVITGSPQLREKSSQGLNPNPNPNPTASFVHPPQERLPADPACDCPPGIFSAT
jgi:hypothetical protein